MKTTWAAMAAGLVCGAAAARENRLVIRADEGRVTIDRNIYGHFAEHLGACIYGGIWVGEDSPIPNTRGIRNDVVAALREIRIPVLRWPGGCFADEYHWMDGIGPRESRPSMINTHWGGITENNHFGTHEFMDLCDQLGCEPYICGNVGSGTVLEMQQWVEYITSDAVSPMTELRGKNGRAEPWRLTYFGVGNENWGCGGNMTPQFYADQYKRYATYVRNYGSNRVFKIACGPNRDNYEWTEILMREAGKRMHGLAPHYYCGSGRIKQPAARFDEADWAALLKRALHIDELVTRHSRIMDTYDPQKKVAMIFDEWGTWHDVEPGTNPRFLYQQNTLRDALVAGVTLNVFNRHADRVKMANIAQTVNVLQAMLLTDGPRMIRTPTFHVYEMFVPHHDATLLPSELTCADYACGDESMPGLSASASRDKSGAIHVTLCNLNPNRPADLSVELTGTIPRQVRGRVLTGVAMQDHNTFDRADAVAPAGFSAFSRTDTGLTVTLPAKSVTALTLFP